MEKSAKTRQKNNGVAPSASVWREKYDRRASDGKRLISFMKEQLDAFGNSNNIALAFPTDGRVKDLESIIGKCSRKTVELSSIDQFEDFVGIRVVCLFKRDIATYDKFIREKFEVDSYEDTSNRLADGSFGYQSNHYIVTLPSQWQDIPSMAGVGSLKVEIQVRTLSQHMWAAVSHKLQYKNESTVPYELRRSINRASAILELIDIEFDRVIMDRDKYVNQIIEITDDDYILNVDVLKNIMTDSLPKDNLEGTERYDVVLAELTALGVTTAGELKSIIKENLNKAIAKDKVNSRSSELKEYTSSTLRSKGCYFNHMGLIRNLLEMKFGSSKTRSVQVES